LTIWPVDLQHDLAVGGQEASQPGTVAAGAFHPEPLDLTQPLRPGQQLTIAPERGGHLQCGQVAAELVEGAGDMHLTVGVDTNGDPTWLELCDGGDGRLPSGQGSMAAPAERADNTATSLWRQAPVRSGSLGWCSPTKATAARVDSSRQRHQASENSGQTQATATAGIIAVKTSTALRGPATTLGSCRRP
jgi:hypothetical protein